MINSKRDTPTLCEHRIGQALTIVPATLAIIVCAAIPAVRAAENRPVAQNAPPSSVPHMTAAEKERALTEFMRRDAAGEKIDPALLKRSSRPRTRVRPPGSRSAKPLLRLN